MSTVETTIRVSIPDGGATLGEVEQRVAEAVQAAGRELLVAACAALEEVVVRVLTRRGQVQRVKTRPLDMLSRFGWVRLVRCQVVDLKEGRYRCPLDEVLGLRPRRHVSPWVLAQAVGLGHPHPLSPGHPTAGGADGDDSGPPDSIRLGSAGGLPGGGR